jgi:glyoxylate/hydroxypyruvate reductase A
MGFQVNGWSRSPKAIEGVTCYAGEAEFDRFLSATDILVVLLPLTDKTTGILNAALIQKLAKDGPLGGPILINAGRGGLQVEADILAALDSGALAGVSLDVFEVEPLSPESPLWRHPKAVVTPHIAADPYPRDIVAAILDHIARYERGEPLTDVVDRRRGY